MRHALRVRARQRGRDETGETLLELLATITILSIGMVAVLAGIGTAIRLSSRHRFSANDDVALTIAAEAIKSATPVACSAVVPSSYRAALDAIPITPSPSSLPANWTTANLSITAATCDNASALKMQTITVTATPPNSTVVESVTVLKRSP